MNIGQRVKYLREGLDMSQQELAALLDYKSPSTIAKIESNKNAMPLNMVARFADELDTTEEYLLGYTDDPYNYENDPDGRIAEIPTAQYKQLHKMCGGDNEKIWHAYEKIQEDEYNEAMQIQHDFPSDDSGIEVLDPIPYNPTHKIPILGRISAGLPIYAEQNIEGYTYTDLNHGAEYFALRVQGDSMNAARICEGDLLIVRRQSVVEEGEIAVVMVDDSEATVKVWHMQHGMVMLEPKSTNPIHKMQFYNPKETHVEILGKVVKVEICM